MKRLLIVGEDSLSCVLGECLVADVLPQWELARESISLAGVTKLIAALPRYSEYARNLNPVLCVADTDGKCPVELLKAWRPVGATDELLIRLAVTEAESWLLADRQAVARFFDVPVGKVPLHPDELRDPKAVVIQLARSSRVKKLRQEMVSPASTKPGAGYQIHLREFARSFWRVRHAADQSPSLQRAIARMTSWGKVHAGNS